MSAKIRFAGAWAALRVQWKTRSGAKLFGVYHSERVELAAKVSGWKPPVWPPLKRKCFIDGSPVEALEVMLHTCQHARVVLYYARQKINQIPAMALQFLEQPAASVQAQMAREQNTQLHFRASALLGAMESILAYRAERKGYAFIPERPDQTRWSHTEFQERWRKLVEQYRVMGEGP